MEEFSGLPCVQSHDMRFKVKVRKPLLIANGWTTPTKHTNQISTLHKLDQQPLV